MRFNGRTVAKTMLASLLVVASAAPAWADMYQCRDRRGGLHFTNVPTSGSCRPMAMRREQTISLSYASSTNSSRYSGFGGYGSGCNSGYSGGYGSQFDRFTGPDNGSFDGSIYWAASRYSLDPLLIKAIILTESAFNVRAVSRRGAQGLMQLMPDTARELFVRNPFDPHENIAGGSRYLRSLMDTFGENLVLSLAAYNAGPGAVMKAGGVPDFPETRQYVVKVLKKYRSLRQGGGRG